MKIWPEAVTDSQAHWLTTHAIFKLCCLYDKKQSKHQQKPTNALNAVESFIGVLQILEDLTHDKLNVSQQLQLGLKVPQCKQDRK